MADTRPDFLPEDTAIFYKGDELWGLDDHGEFRVDPPRGSPEKQDGRCNATLKYTEERYGETRYCSRTPYWPADDSDEEPSEFCKVHKGFDALMERAIELIRHGYFGRNYALFEESLDASEFAMAVDMFAGLLESSQYDFNVDTEVYIVDASDDPFIEDEEILVEVYYPQSEKYKTQAQELWYFALDEVVEQRMQNIRLQQGVSTSHVVATADEDGAITDRIEEGSEHHLNLPISRLTKDKKNRLKIGGVEVGAEEGDQHVTFTTGDYVMDLGNEVEEEAPELEGPITPELEVDEEHD